MADNQYSVEIVPENYKNTVTNVKMALRFGATQSVCGGLALIFQLVGIIIGDYISEIGTGIWCGMIFIIAGILGIVSSINKESRSLALSFMVLSIIASVFAFLLLIMCIPGLNESRYHLIGGFVINVFLLVIAVTEVTIAVLSAVCCRVRCGCCKTPPPAAYFFPAYNQNHTVGEITTNAQMPLATVPCFGNVTAQRNIREQQNGNTYAIKPLSNSEEINIPAPPYFQTEEINC